MFLLNLTLPEFLALFGLVTGLVVTLYLLDRVRKAHKVATLHFFPRTARQQHVQHRRKLQQPWSLLVQLVSLALLLLAIAQLRVGGSAHAARDHVLVMDTSATMAAKAGQGRLIDRAREAAGAYLRRLPTGDRVMLVRAGELVTPAVPFSADRAAVLRAVNESQPGSGPFNLEQALEFAQDARRLQAHAGGEIVLVGALRADPEHAETAAPPGLRLIPIDSKLPNTGFRKMAARRKAADPEAWDIFLSVRNGSERPQSVPLGVQFGGAPVASRRVLLKPRSEENIALHYRTRAAGILEARLFTNDAFPGDDRVTLELPAYSETIVAIYSDEPELLKPIFAAIPGVKALYAPAAAYKPDARAQITVLDRFVPAIAPDTASIWLAPPAPRSPVHVRSVASKLKLAGWRTGHPLAMGLHTRDAELESAEIFTLAEGDIPVANAISGPIIVARPSPRKMLVFGFHPMLSAMRYELATPLLFANAVRWMAPDAFAGRELAASSTGIVDVPLDAEADPSAVRVTAAGGRELPFTVQGGHLRFFDATPGSVQVSAGGRELVYSLTLPDAGGVPWRPAGASTGLPAVPPGESTPWETWPWLALAGGIGLFLDWIFFARSRELTPAGAARRVQPSPWRKAS